MKQIILISLVCVALLFGCAGSNEQKQPAATGKSQQGNGAAASSGSTKNDVSTGTFAQNALESLLGTLKLNSGWKVTYQLSGTGMQGTTEMSQYVKGTEKFRTDVSAAGMETRTYVMDNKAYLCTKTGEWSCLKFTVPKNDSSQASYELESELETDASKYNVTADGTMQVAGVTAACFKVVSADASTRYCVSAEGVPLYVKSSAQSEGQAVEYEMKAKSYSASVSDSDFALPAEPQEFSLPGANGSGAGANLCSYCGYMSGSDKTECLASCK